MAIGKQFQALGAAREHRQRIGQPRKGWFCDFSDRNRVMLRRADLRHTRTSRTARAT